MHDASIHRRREEIVSRAHGVDITGEVKVEILHGHDLRIATAGRTTLDTKGGTLRRLPDNREHLLADVVQALAHTNGGHGLSLAQRGRGDGRDIDVFAIRAILESFKDIKMNLGLVLSIKVQIIFGQAHQFGNL